MRRKLTEEQIEQINRLFGEELTTSEIAKALNLPYYMVYRQKPEVKAKLRKYYQTHYQTHREEILAKRKYYQRPEVKAKQRKYRQRHREEKKEYYRRHREERLAYQKEYYQKHREEILAKKREYRQRPEVKEAFLQFDNLLQNIENTSELVLKDNPIFSILLLLNETNHGFKCKQIRRNLEERGVKFSRSYINELLRREMISYNQDKRYVLSDEGKACLEKVKNYQNG